MPKFFEYFQGLLNHVTLWSKLLTGDLKRYSVTYDLHLSIKRPERLTNDEITNSYAELYFHLKKADETKKNQPLGRFISQNKKFNLAIKRQFVDKLVKKEFEDHGRDQSNYLRKALGNINEDQSVTVEEESWLPKRKPNTRKRKQSVLKSPSRPIHFHPKKRKTSGKIGTLAKDMKTHFSSVLNFTIHKKLKDFHNYLVQDRKIQITNINLDQFHCLDAKDKDTYSTFPIIDWNVADKKPAVEGTKTLSRRGITNRHNICYVNSVLQLLLGSRVKEFLELGKSNSMILAL